MNKKSSLREIVNVLNGIANVFITIILAIVAIFVGIAKALSNSKGKW